MKIKIILVVLAVGLLGLAVFIATQPADFRITRSTTIAAPASAIFPQVNDFHLWQAWSPWAKLDPAMKQTYEGATNGVGSIYNWAGNSEVGEGRMTITESRSPEWVRIHLEFLKPFKAVNTTEFSLKPEGNQTSVTWSMAGSNNFMAKAAGLFMNMDKMVGADFEKGLAALKEVAERAPGSK